MTSRRLFLLSVFEWFPLYRLFRPRFVKLAGVRFEVIRHGSSKKKYLHIHGNETTAREVIRDHMTRYKGTAYTVTGPDRNVPAGDGIIDPNRLFSREGAEKSLRALNKAWSDDQVKRELDRLDRERNKLINRLLPPQGGLLVAIHNNSQGYSVRAEVDASDKVALNDANNPHEFFLATTSPDFNILAKSPYNVVLQEKVIPVDDGSLSRLAAKRGFRYVNLEVGLGKRERQIEMLDWLERNIK